MVANLYANENFPAPVVNALRQLGHDVLTSFQAGNANKSVPDEQVLDFATQQDRAVVTLNRDDFRKLHRSNAGHAGIIVCTEDLDFAALAQRIDQHIRNHNPLRGKLIRVNRS